MMPVNSIAKRFIGNNSGARVKNYNSYCNIKGFIQFNSIITTLGSSQKTYDTNFKFTALLTDPILFNINNHI
jgi:hypothetical protein